MSANKEIRMLMLQECLTISKVVKIVEKKFGKHFTADGLSKKLRNNTLKFVEAEIIADALDYDILFKKRVKV